MAKPITNKDDNADYELNASSAVSSSAAGSSAATPKGHATPTRKEREAANLRPLVSNDRKAGNRESRARAAESRDKARIGMANGEEKYLPTKDKGPQRRYIRDYVDARFSIGEMMIPFLGIVIILNAISKTLTAIGTIVLWAFLIVMVLDCLWAGVILKKKLTEKFGADKLQGGYRWYIATRAAQFRRMRLPKPQVKRGQYPV